MLFPSKEALSCQILGAIKNKWGKECPCTLDEVKLSINDVVSDFNRSAENYSIKSVDAIALDRIKERLETVEELNDHLCHYIRFLIENLPELIMKTIQSSNDLDFSIEKNHGKCYTNGLMVNKAVYPIPTPREHDVLELLERGLCAKEIASRLYISETTVITHKKNLKKKFNVKNTAELISKIRIGDEQK